ncbi:MAG: D-sedoheptulose 7-phosphate isomerase [Candidatus Omnitrophica bacterium]|nr:D-sedoheptulose 7-phosphate isomerase [Candidatus Omnitrophota bacterium]
MKEQIKAIFEESKSLQEKLMGDDIVEAIAKLAQSIKACIGEGGKVILFGNGGSAADAQHIAAELVGRFTKERKPLAALALNCNTSNLTCIGNDYGFEQVFARQIEALGNKKDIAIGISTSGTSQNVLTAISKAKELGMKTAALTSERSDKLAKNVDVAVSVPSKNTARIQEAHITIGHIICQLVEKDLL